MRRMEEVERTAPAGETGAGDEAAGPGRGHEASGPGRGHEAGGAGGAAAPTAADGRRQGHPPGETPSAGRRGEDLTAPAWLRPLVGTDSLRSQLLSGLTVLLFVALLAMVIALLLWLPEVPSPGVLLVGLLLLIVADVTVMVLFGDYLLRKQFLQPVERMVEGAESIAAGERVRRLAEGGSNEMRRLAASINRMADRLIRNQELLAENVRSLNETNEALTEAQNELIRAEKLASVGRLAAGIAHEVGNPLGAILGYTELARRERSGATEWLDEIRDEAQRIDRLVRGLLDYARPRAAAIRTVEVNEVVEEAVALLETRGQLKDVRTRLELASPSPSVKADAHQLEQVMVNLLLNARDAVEGGEGEGTIVLRTSAEVYQGPEPPESRRPARRRDDPAGIDYSHLRRLERRPSPLPIPAFARGDPVVRIEVEDDGPGLPQGERSLLFDPFYTTKQPGRGTGLGLAVSARLVAGMGGAIHASSRPEGGARFTVLLPVPGPRGEGVGGEAATGGLEGGVER